MKKLIYSVCLLTLSMFTGVAWANGVVKFDRATPENHEDLCENAPTDGLGGTWKSTPGKPDTCKLNGHVSDVRIEIRRDDMILDGDGSTLAGLGTGHCILLSGAEGVTVKDLTLESCDDSGVKLEESEHNTVKGIRTGPAMSVGIYLDVSDFNTVKYNVLSNMIYTGISVDNSEGNSIKYNCIELMDTGIEVLDSGNNSIKRNRLQAIGDFDIYMDIDSTGNVVTRNRCQDGCGDIEDEGDNKVVKNVALTAEDKLCPLGVVW